MRKRTISFNYYEKEKLTWGGVSHPPPVMFRSNIEVNGENQLSFSQTNLKFHSKNHSNDNKETEFLPHTQIF